MHPVLGITFVFYIFFMYFGVLNVVVGAFVATTAEIALKDKDALVRAETERLKNYTIHIKRFFRAADTDNDGHLTWEEFEEHLTKPEVQAYFRSMDLNVTQAGRLFDLLDVDLSNKVTVNEFLEGCIRLKGQASSIDMNMLLLTQERTFERINRVFKRFEQYWTGAR